MTKLAIRAAVLAALTSASPAFADDADWSGAHVGVYAEASYDESGFEDFSCWTACTRPSLQGTSLKAGATLGYDLEVDDSLVIGLAGDFGTGSRRSMVEGAAVGIIGTPVYTLQSETDYEANVRARVGMSTGKTLVYITGGIGFARTRFSAEGRNVVSWYPTIQSPNFGAVWEGTMSGPVFGGGIEHRFGGASARIEVLHRRYEPASACFANSDGANAGVCWPVLYSIPAQMNFDTQSTALRFGLSYRF